LHRPRRRALTGDPAAGALAGGGGEPLPVTARVVLDALECDIRATTGGGPGGQHVNRSATRIELRWHPATSASLARALAPDHRDRVLARLARRLDADGTLRIVAAEHRSQRRNRTAALERLAAIVRAALPDPLPRKATRPSRAAVERRLEAKQRQARVKRQRRRPDVE
jgi:ribosome-associated protein